MAPTPPITVYEGRLLEPRFGWTLLAGYTTLTPVDRVASAEQKAQAMLRALHLMGTLQAEVLDVNNLHFRRGQAPILLVESERVGADATDLPVLSLAHSGSLLLAAAGAATDLVVGVDVEQLRQRDFQRIETHMGWCDAAALWPHPVDPVSAKLLFYRRWTLAESLYKALGKVNLECFTELERLAVDGLWAVADSTPTGGWDSGWLSKVVGGRRWFVRWWRVRNKAESAMVCLLRGTAI